MRQPPTAPGLDTLEFTPAPYSETRHYRLLTPLFGGGVVPGENDANMLIRGASIRGQLRFWWRATRGGQFNGDIKKMKEAEDLLWGAASKPKKPRPSQVQIKVNVERSGTPVPVNEVPSYAAFALRENNQHATLQKDIEFALTIAYPQSAAQEVEAALWAWETFGGIGARTRRGFGALQRMDAEAEKPANPQQVLTYLNERLTHYGVSGAWPDDVPHLPVYPPGLVPGTNFKTSDPGQVNGVWSTLITKLRNFRQERNPGTQPNRPGRSRWPEPDEIRRLKPPAPSRHATPIYSPPHIRKFPRAAFGLPIIFHFVGAGEPSDTTLQGANYERLASPLILRPLACANNQAVGLAIILKTPRLPSGGVILKDGATHHVVDTILDPITEAGRLTKATGTPLLMGQTDVLQAFLATL